MQQVFDLRIDHCADLAKLVGVQILWIGNAPIFMNAGADHRTGVAAAHGDRGLEFHVGNIGESLRSVLAQVVTEFAHRSDRLGIDDAGRARAGAVGLELPLAVHFDERLGQLAAARVLDTNKQHALGRR